MSKIAQDYLTCALWASVADDGTPLDSGDYELAPEAREALEKQADDFEAAHPDQCGQWEELGFFPGHDLWLTRNGHGAGFWCRKAPKDLQTYLNEAARALPEVNLYVGDDGLIYIL